ncbi:MAG: 50S ribosomal protein L7ae [Hydrogenothermaceae bacterium]
MKENLEPLLRLAYKAGSVKFGFETLERIKGDYFLIVAKDLSKRTERNIFSKFKVDVYQIWDKDKLSKLFGKNNIGVVIVKKDGLGMKIQTILERSLKEEVLEEKC